MDRQLIGDKEGAIADLQEAISLLEEAGKEEEAKKLLVRLTTLRKY